MSRPCSACCHAKKAEIDAALATGASVRAVGAQFGLSHGAVHNHLRRCLAPQIAAAARVTRSAREVRAPIERARAVAMGAEASFADVLSLDALLGRIARSLERLEASADDAADAKLPTALAAVSGQLHRGVEVAARLQNIGAPDVAGGPAFSVSIVLPPHPTTEGSRPEPAIIDAGPKPVSVAIKARSPDTL